MSIHTVDILTLIFIHQSCANSVVLQCLHNSVLSCQTDCGLLRGLSYVLFLICMSRCFSEWSVNTIG